MDATIRALGEILLKALPTFFLVLLLHFYLRRVFFSPLEKVLKSREEATEGARRQAALSLEMAEKKAAEYEEALRNARTELYKEQEQHRKQWREDQAALVEDARRKASAMVDDARNQIESEAASARIALEAQAEALAEEISVAVLNRRAR
jgi:F-type H+-transporting ATPase subunit b